jgi:hypothetical protein
MISRAVAVISRAVAVATELQMLRSIVRRCGGSQRGSESSECSGATKWIGSTCEWGVKYAFLAPALVWRPGRREKREAMISRAVASEYQSLRGPPATVAGWAESKHAGLAHDTPADDSDM